MSDTINNDPVLIDLPVPIRTEGLTLRPVQTGDGAGLHEAKQETWEQINKWMPWAKKPGNAEEDEATVRKAYAKYILREDMMLVGIENETGAPVIWTGLHRFDWELRNFEIGYWVRKSAQGKGYATESTNALIRYAFNALNARAVVISHAEGNEPSRAVINKLGFVKCGQKTDAMLLPDGTVTNSWEYELLTDENLPPLEVSWGPP